MELADDICYSVHDLEDAINLNLITRENFFDALAAIRGSKAWDTLSQKIDEAMQREDISIRNRESINKIVINLFHADDSVRKEKIGNLIHIFISHCRLQQKTSFVSPILRFNALLPEPFCDFLKLLNEIISKIVINSPTVQQLEFKGQRIIIELFEVIATDPERFLPVDKAKAYQDVESQKKGSGMRTICDYIAGMTDEFASKLYERMFCPHYGSVFDRL